ncbi:MAG: galactose oxidase, partial [Firmicutes bacterium]|nr:galactose oxidase [Bacillota bacterium]
MSIKKVRSLFLALVLTLFVTMSIALPFAFAEDSWETKSPMPTGRHSFSAVEANGKIYAIGGAGTARSVEEYDPTTDTWSKKTDTPTEIISCGVAEVNRKIYVIGRKNVHEYNPATNTWVTKADTTNREQFGVAEVNGKIYAIGGNNNGPLNTVEEYDPATDTW